MSALVSINMSLVETCISAISQIAGSSA